MTVAIEKPGPREVTLPTLGRCRNCDAELVGRYCVNCSQAADVHVPTTRELIHEALEGLTHSDSRLWRTLTWLWFKPGKLTMEFIAGRRMAFLPPFRLYLILSVGFFLLAALSHSDLHTIGFDNTATRSGKITNCDDVNFAEFAGHPEWGPRIRHACETVARDNGTNLFHIAASTMPKAMFLFLPLIALLHMLMYWWPRHRYAEHLLFFIHLHAFFFSAMAVALLVGLAADAWHLLRPVSAVVVPVLLWYQPLYTLVAMKRVFRRGWPGTLFKGVVLLIVYEIVLGLTVAGVFIYAMLQLL